MPRAQLSERHTVDRLTMAEQLKDAMEEEGGSVEVKSSPLFDRCIQLTIAAPGGATASVEFRGDHIQPDVYVVTWNLRYRDARETRFNPDIGDVNPFHGRKATRVARGFRQLKTILVNDMRRFVDGSGYVPYNLVTQ